MKEIGFNNTGVILHMIFNDLELYKTDLMKFFYITKIYIYIYIYIHEIVEVIAYITIVGTYKK